MIGRYHDPDADEDDQIRVIHALEFDGKQSSTESDKSDDKAFLARRTNRQRTPTIRIFHSEERRFQNTHLRANEILKSSYRSARNVCKYGNSIEAAIFLTNIHQGLVEQHSDASAMDLEHIFTPYGDLIKKRFDVPEMTLKKSSGSKEEKISSPPILITTMLLRVYKWTTQYLQNG